MMRKFKILTAAIAMAAMGSAGSSPAHAQSGTQFIGQISAFGGSFCPREWAEANGAIVAISSNEALFAILGTQFGGDGRNTFALPDLQGRRPVGAGSGPGLGNFGMGQKGGQFEFQLTTAHLPSHTHTGLVAASPAAGNTNQPVRNSFALSPAGTNNFVTGDPAINNMHRDTLRINPTGGSVAVNKVSPFTTVRWCIALVGIFPPRS